MGFSHRLCCVCCLALVSAAFAQTMHSAVEQVLNKYDTNGDHALDDVEWDSMYYTFFPAHAEDHDDHDHEGHSHRTLKTRKPSIELNGYHQLVLRHEDEDDDHDHGDNHTEVCHSAHEIFEFYDWNHDGRLNETELEPALVVVFSMLTTPDKCAPAKTVVPKTVASDPCPAPEPYVAWLSGIFASLLISAVALVVILAIPAHAKFLDVYLMPLVSFAIGNLLGDAALHLIPGALGVHGHGSSHVEDRLEMWYLGPCSFILLGILLFGIMEKLLLKIHRHHVPGGDNNEVRLEDIAVEKELSRAESSTNITEETPNGGDNSQPTKELHGVPSSTSLLSMENIKHVKSQGWMIVFADGVHNFVDGLAMGIAFADNIRVGIATTIAVFLHEVPQEIGDFGVMLDSGFTKSQAAVLNLLSALTCIVGTIIGLGIGSAATNADEWLLPLVAGGFFYIALVDMMPVVLRETGFLRILVDFGCMVLGFFIMLAIALWGEGIVLCGDTHDH